MRRINVCKFTADHLRDDLVSRHFCCRPCTYIGAVTHDGDIIGDPLDLIHLVRNIDHSNALITKIVHDTEQYFNFFVREGGRRFVENDDLRLVRNCLRNFDGLHLTDGKSGKRSFGIKVHTYFFEPVSSIFIHLLVVDDFKRAVIVGRESAEIHILGNTSGEYRLKFLMHHGNTHLHGLIGIVNYNLFAVYIDFSGIHLVNAEQALH